MNKKFKISGTLIKKQVIPFLLTSVMLSALSPAGFAAEETLPNAADTAAAEIETRTISESMEAQALLTAEETTVKKPEAGVKPGLYRTPQTVSLSAEAGAKIYYTTNNLMPDESGAEYTGPIAVNEDTNICAIAVNEAGVKSAPVTFGYLIRGEETPQLQFMVMSDVEIGEGLEEAGGDEEAVRALDYPRIDEAMAVTKGIFDNPDLLVMNGDIVKCNSGKPDKAPDHAIFVKLMQEAMAANGLDGTKVQVTMGNHDALGHSVSAMKGYYTGTAADWFPAEAAGYYHKTLTGRDQQSYHFFYLNSNTAASAQTSWFQDELAKITDMSAPIFVFMHIPISGSLDDTRWNYTESWIKAALADRPQAIVFSGHTHKTISEDRSIGQNLGFTAVNEGTMTYAETTDYDLYSHDASGGAAVLYQFPVAQCAAVEVYSDRIEINRITINGDAGNAKANGYVPKEPFNNCGFTAGDKWVIQRGQTGDAWSAAFAYTPEKRKANAPVPAFAEGAAPALAISGRTATVTLPQTQDAQKTHYYMIELADENGNTCKSLKVQSERVFSPMPKTLTYDISGLKQGTSYTARVTAYNEYGRGSAPIVSAAAEAETLPGAQAQLLTSETFSQAETDETLHAVPYIDSWGSGAAAEVKYKNGTAVFSSLGDGDTIEMWIPFQPKVKKEDESLSFNLLPGEFFLEYEYQMLDGMKEGVSWFRSANGNVMKVLFSSDGKTITPQTSGATNKDWTTYKSASADFKTKPVKLKYLLGTKDGKQYIRGFWVNGTLIEDRTQAVDFNGSADGWKQMNFALPSNTSNYTTGTGTEYCAVDNFRVWKPISAQIQELVKQGKDNVTFDQIKGGNTDQNGVTQNLTLSELVDTQTQNGLVVTGWTSDKENVIRPDGTVQRPLSEDAAVTLTPLLGMVDTIGETDQDYVTAPGTAIVVTVKNLGQEPLDVAATQDIVNEDFTTDYAGVTESDTTILPFAYNWHSNKVLGVSTMTFSGGENGAAIWGSTKGQSGQEFGIPFQPGTTLGVKTEPDTKVGDTTYSAKPLDGEFTFEFDVTFLDALPAGGLWLYLRNGNGKNTARIELGNTTAKYYYYTDAANSQQLGSTKTIQNQATHKVRMTLGTEGNTPYLNGLWIDGGAVTTARQKITHDNYQGGTGWTALIATAGAKNGITTAGDYCAIDNIRCYRSPEDQAKELAGAEEGKITFAQIRGENTDPNNVTAKLDLKSGEAGRLQTANNLLVTGWTSGNPDVITADGTVIPSETGDCTVALTPSLAIRDAETGNYVSADGSPIVVTVPQKQSPLEVATTGYIANEDYTTQYTGTNEDHAKTVLPYASARSGGGVSVDYTGGAVTLKSTVEGKGFDFYLPFQPGTAQDGNGKYTTPELSGEFTYEFDLNMLANAKSQGLWLYLQGQSGTNLARLVMNSASIDLKYYKDGSSSLTDVSSISISGDTHRFKFVLGTDENNVPYIADAKVDNKSLMGGSAKLVNTGFTGGWMRMVTVTGNQWKSGDYYSIDNVKCYRSPEDQAKELAAAETGKITFAQIRGENTDPNNVTVNLDLKSGEEGRLLTENKMLVMGWTSGNTDVITNEGAVTPPAIGSAAVDLTPRLAILNQDTGAYVSVAGQPVTVTVKGDALGFLDGNGSKAEVLNSAVTKGAADISGFTGQVHAIAALYTGEQLEQVWAGNTVDAETADIAEVAIDNLPADLAGKTMKLFVWESGSMIPLYAPAQLNPAQ